jgi:hypothetical protein
MKEKKLIGLTKGWFWVIVISVFFLGVMSSTDTTTKEVVKEGPKEVVKEVCPQEMTWKRLKEVDDKGFVASSEAMYLASEAFIAISNLDFDKVGSISDQMIDKTKEIEKIGVERNSILKELGY